MTLVVSLAPWVLAGISMPLVLAWAWNLPLGSWGRFGDVLGTFILTLDFMVWPSSMLLWESGHYMPDLLRLPLFRESIGINALIYMMMGFLFWTTRNRFGWIRYVAVGFWLAVCLGIPVIGLATLMGPRGLALCLWAIFTWIIFRWMVLLYRCS